MQTVQNHTRTRKAALVVVTTLVFVITGALPAWAHGEAAQEGFLRMRTIAFSDVEFSDTTVAQGETLTIRGVSRVMQTWPTTLGDPRIGHLGIIAPGPVVALETRTINEHPVPGRFEIERGQVFEWEMTVMGRRPGRWHIHPGFAVQGSGTVLGPGEWITVEENPAGYEFPVTLTSGTIVNLENFGLGFVWSWQVLTFLIGLGWLLYWIGPKPTVTRAAVSLRIPLNSDGGEVGLITDRDHRIMNMFALAIVVVLAAGFVYQAVAYPEKIPPQVVSLQLPSATDRIAEVQVTNTAADFDVATDSLLVEAEVTNNGSSALNLVGYATSTLSFEVDGETPLVTDPADVAIAPGETAAVSLSMESHAWTEEQLVELTGAGRERIAGVLIFEDAAGQRSMAEVDAVMLRSAH